MPESETEATQMSLTHALAGALIGSTVNVLLHFIGPQKTSELMQTVFALSDRHRETPCDGECAFFDELTAILKPYLDGHVSETDFGSIVVLIDNMVDLSGATAEQSSHMVTAIFNMNGVDARATAPVTA